MKVLKVKSQIFFWNNTIEEALNSYYIRIINTFDRWGNNLAFLPPSYYLCSSRLHSVVTIRSGVGRNGRLRIHRELLRDGMKKREENLWCSMHQSHVLTAPTALSCLLSYGQLGHPSCFLLRALGGMIELHYFESVDVWGFFLVLHIRADQFAKEHSSNKEMEKEDSRVDENGWHKHGREVAYFILRALQAGL